MGGKSQPKLLDWESPEKAAESSYTNKSKMATPSTHSPLTEKESLGAMLSTDVHDGESPATSGSLKTTCIHPRGSVATVKTLTIWTVTLTLGTKFKMTNTPFGSLRANSSLVSMTPLV